LSGVARGRFRAELGGAAPTLVRPVLNLRSQLVTWSGPTVVGAGKDDQRSEGVGGGGMRPEETRDQRAAAVFSWGGQTPPNRTRPPTPESHPSSGIGPGRRCPCNRTAEPGPLESVGHQHHSRLGERPLHPGPCPIADHKGKPPVPSTAGCQKSARSSGSACSVTHV
jgi:hypothetical protein